MDTLKLAEKILDEVSEEAKILAYEVTEAMFTKNRSVRRLTKNEMRSVLVSTLWKYEQTQKEK